MFGSIFYNFWGALGAFTLYFLWALQQPFPQPIPVILQSFLVALVGFIFMFAIRYLLNYILYTPEQTETAELQVQQAEGEELSDLDLLMQEKNQSVSEFQDEDSEEIAKVVRTMLHGQSEATPN